MLKWQKFDRQWMTLEDEGGLIYAEIYYHSQLYDKEYFYGVANIYKNVVISSAKYQMHYNDVEEAIADINSIAKMLWNEEVIE